jgi:16S rRNA (guanine(966)-N(2))-methyltransferase RsmD
LQPNLLKKIEDSTIIFNKPNHFYPQNMRITGGTLGGRTLNTSGFVGIRPTTDRAREMMFNILANHCDFEGLHVLDLCAGTGALGFETISRGASSGVFVEKHRGNAERIRTSAQMLGVSDQTTILCADCVKAITILNNSTNQAASQLAPSNIVFCDPPYAAKLINPVVAALQSSSILAPNAIFVAEHDTREAVLPPHGWEKFAERVLGETMVEFFRTSSNA